MNPTRESGIQSYYPFNNYAIAGVVALLLLLPLKGLGGGVVTNCTASNLRAAMVGGGTVSFACDGTITLSSTITISVDTVLDGSGHQITISGGSSVRVFYLNTNISFTVRDLTIANGAGGDGAGIFNNGGRLILLNDLFLTNSANAGAHGGAVFNRAGAVNATNCAFIGNRAGDSLPSDLIWVRGGAIRNESGEVNLSASVFAANHVSGPGTITNFSSGGTGWGGAVDNSGILNANLCNFIGNSVVGTRGLDRGYTYVPDTGGPGGNSSGAAIYNSGTMTISRCTFSGNCASGGTGGRGTSGISAASGMPAGSGGSGGGGRGGAVYNDGVAQLINTTFGFNCGTGGNGGQGGDGGQAYMPGQHSRNGGDGGVGGNGNGAVFNAGTAHVINSTFAFNSAGGGIGGQGGRGGNGADYNIAGNGGYGGGGGSAFGGIYDTNGLCWITNCALAANSGTNGGGGAGGAGGFGVPPGTPGASGPSGTAGGGIKTTGGTLVNTLLAANVPGGNCYGKITDAGHNLSSDASCAFTNLGSLNTTDPKLGPLANNGGPTLTMALLPGSPAIDGGDDALAPATDQRGFPRPVGAAADIGAFEYGSPALLHISRSSETDVEIFVLGVKTQWCRLFTSTTLSDWQCVATNQLGVNGTVLFQDNCGSGETQRFYRVALP